MTEIRDKMGRVTGTTATTITVNIDTTDFSVYSSGGTGWEFDLDWSDNPADVVFDILTDPVILGDGSGTPYEVDRFRGYSPTKINKTKLYELASFCDDSVDDGRGGTEDRMRFNGVFDTATDRWSAVMKVCEVARCVPIYDGVEITFAIDKTRSPVQKFNVANIDLDTFEENWLEQAGLGSEYEIHYIDEDLDYRREVMPVVDPLIETTSNRITLNILGLTKQSEVWRAAKFRLAKNRLLKSAISFRGDIDALDATIGDNIYVQHDVPDQWGDGGMVVSGTVWDIVVEKDLTYVDGSTYKLLVRLSDDTLENKTVLTAYSDITGVNQGAKTFTIAGNYTSAYKSGDKITVADSTGNDGVYTLSIDSTFAASETTITVDESIPDATVDGGLYNNRRIAVTVAFSAAPTAGDLWTFGAQDIQEYTILDLSRDADRKVKLTCLEYDDSYHDFDSDTPEITADQGITAPVSAPFMQIDPSWQAITERFPTVLTVGPPQSDTPMYAGIIFSDDLVNNRVNWTAGTIYYQGAAYAVTAGNSGSPKYVYWDVGASPTTFQATDTLANAVGSGKFIRCVNDNGVAHVVGEGELYWGEMLIVETLSAISAQLGDVLAGTITGTQITGSIIRTATSGKRLRMDSNGLRLLYSSGGGIYGTTGNGGSNLVYGTTGAGGSNAAYGSGALASINHPSENVPVYVHSETNYGEFHHPDRSSAPSGAAEVGDTCVINGTTSVCTAAGTPGTWEPAARFHDRGDPSAYDYTVSDFTTDGTWRDKDISGIVGAGKRLVLLRVTINYTVAATAFQLRENGNSNGHNAAVLVTHVANIPLYSDVWVMTDSSGVIEYKGDNVTFTTINVLVRGWWEYD
jgi:hypothetical protein